MLRYPTGSVGVHGALQRARGQHRSSIRRFRSAQEGVGRKRGRRQAGETGISRHSHPRFLVSHHLLGSCAPRNIVECLSRIDIASVQDMPYMRPGYQPCLTGCATTTVAHGILGMPTGVAWLLRGFTAACSASTTFSRPTSAARQQHHSTPLHPRLAHVTLYPPATHVVGGVYEQAPGVAHVHSTILQQRLHR